MKKPRLGIAYSISGNYVLKTLPSLISILENNWKCSEESKVDLIIYFYILDIEEELLGKLQEICGKYKAVLKIIDSKECIECLEKAGDVAYLGSLINDVFLAAFDKLEVDYNVLFLETDVVLNHNHSLKALAEYDFDGGRKSCASTIELQSSKEIKKIMPLSDNQHVFNCGVILGSPRLYQAHNTFRKYADSINERGWKFYPYWNVLRNAYGLKDEICILPMRYQVYPAQTMLAPAQWLKIFGLKKEDYYSKEEIREAIKNPVFIHYVNFIVKKPWMRDLPKRYKSVGYWPFQNIWNYYADLLGMREILMEDWEKTCQEKLKRFLFNHHTTLYVWLCTIFYNKEVKRRNKLIGSLSDKDKALYITMR